MDELLNRPSTRSQRGQGAFVPVPLPEINVLKFLSEKSIKNYQETQNHHKETQKNYKGTQHDYKETQNDHINTK